MEFMDERKSNHTKRTQLKSKQRRIHEGLTCKIE